MSDELKPCPFCGGEATVESGYSRQNEYVYIQCCTCLIETQPAGDPRTAIAAWNRRSADGELSDEQMQKLADELRNRDKEILTLRGKLNDAEAEYHALLDEVGELRDAVSVKRKDPDAVGISLEGIVVILTRIIDKHKEVQGEIPTHNS